MKLKPEILSAIQLCRIDAKSDTSLSMAHYANVDPGGGNMTVIKQKTLSHYKAHLKRRIDELLEHLELGTQEAEYISGIVSSESTHFEEINASAKNESKDEQQ